MESAVPALIYSSFTSYLLIICATSVQIQLISEVKPKYFLPNIYMKSVQHLHRNCATKEECIRGTFKSKAPLRVQFSPALGGEGVGKG